jgi:hypothetical protein
MTAGPFKWTKSADQILAPVKRHWGVFDLVSCYRIAWRAGLNRELR